MRTFWKYDQCNASIHQKEIDTRFRLYPHDVLTMATDNLQNVPKRRSWILRLFEIILTHKMSAIVALSSSVFGMLVQVIIPLIERHIVDRVMIAHQGGVTLFALLILALALLAFGLSIARRYFGGRLALDVQHDLRAKIYTHLQRLDFAKHDEFQTGQLVSRANSDIGLVQGLLSFLPMMIGNFVMLVVSLIVMLYISPILGLTEFLALPFMAFLSISLSSKLFPAAYDTQLKDGEVNVVVEEAIAGVRIVKGYGQTKVISARFRENTLGLFRASVRETKIQAILQSSLSFVPNLVQGAVFVLGGLIALRGQMTIGTFLVFFSYIVQISAPIRQVSVLISFSQQARAGVERIFEILDANPLVANAKTIEEFPGSIESVLFDSVEFAYQPESKVLGGLDLKLERDKITAIAGLSGSGKSTLALLIPRFYDVTGGSISLNGIDIRKLDLTELRRHIGVVFEESFLFSDTIRNNIAYGYPEATSEEVLLAARRSGAYEFIIALPNGFDTQIGEGGVTLSGGQRQRLSLARALVTDPAILILDDATSAVDGTTEFNINRELRDFSAGRIVLLIAHRKSTLSIADEIVLLSNGVVETRGSLVELQGRHPTFQKLFETMTGTVEDDSDEIELASTPRFSPNQIAPGFALRDRSIKSRSKGRGTGGRMTASLVPTPKLLAQLERLTVEKTDPLVDVTLIENQNNEFTFLRFLKPFQRMLIISFLLIAIDTILSLTGPWLVRFGIDNGVLRKSHGVIFGVGIAYVFVACADYLVVLFQQRLSGITAQRVLYALRIRIFAQLQRLGLSFYESEMAGRIMTRITTDVDALSDLLQSGLVNAFVNVLSFVGVGVVMIAINWRLSLAGLYVLVPFGLATYWFQRQSSRAYKLARERIAVVNANLQEGISGVRVAQAYNRGESNSLSFSNDSKNYRDARMQAQRLIAIYFPFVLFLSDLASASVLWFGAGLVVKHQLSVGAVIAFTLYIDQLFAPIQQLSQTFGQWQQAQVATGQISKILNRTTDTPEVPNPVIFRPEIGLITFDNVSFKYRSNSRMALNDVSFTVGAGETVALVGQTGAGKSTVIKLIARFYDPSSGMIKVDGQNIRDVELDGYRHALGYVPQEPFLFAGTVADNISFASPDASDSDIRAAARAVGADDLILRLPGGYDFEVTERGRRLSLGHRQLIALARAYLVHPQILLLDEATANLDLATERRVSDALRSVVKGRTCILIAHRLETAILADRILVFDQGMLVGQGRHEELIEVSEIYSKMWEHYFFTSSGVEGR